MSLESQATFFVLSCTFQVLLLFISVSVGRASLDTTVMNSSILADVFSDSAISLRMW